MIEFIDKNAGGYPYLVKIGKNLRNEILDGLYVSDHPLFEGIPYRGYIISTYQNAVMFQREEDATIFSLRL